MTDDEKFMAGRVGYHLDNLPMSFAMRWCEPGPDGCACLGCANGPEAGAGNLQALGFTKADWQLWVQHRCDDIPESGS